MPPSLDLVIVGHGGLGREVLVLLRQLALADPADAWIVRGFYDDRPAAEPIDGLPWLGSVADLGSAGEPLAVAVGIGYCAPKRAVVERLAANPRLRFPALRHPSVGWFDFQRHAAGEGSLVAEQCILTTNVRLGRYVLLNLGCTVGHDCVVGDYCSLMPRVNLGGGAELGAGVFVGTGATVLPGIRVGAGVTVGAGAVVTKDVPPGQTVAGVPARVLKP